MPEFNSIVRLRSHENRTPTGRASATATRKLVNYLAYGRGRPAHQAQRSPRGVWHDQANKKQSHEDVLAWVQKQGKAQRFTHQLILSVKEAQLDVAAYNDALAAGDERFFDIWRLMTHADSAYPHAHVVAFGDEEIHIKSLRFREWWLTVRQELDARQQAYLARLEAERAAEQEAAQGAGQEAGQEIRLDEKHKSELAAQANIRPHQETAADPTTTSERQTGSETDLTANLDMGWEI